MVIEIRSKLVKLQLISMNDHRNKKQIGRNNHLQTLFHTHFYILSNWKRFQQNPITSKHYMTISKKTSSQTKPRVWERIREKKGRASLKNSMNGFFDAMV